MFLQLLLTSATEKPGSQKLSEVKHLRLTLGQRLKCFILQLVRCPSTFFYYDNENFLLNSFILQISKH